jgi:hypothetical protein
MIITRVYNQVSSADMRELGDRNVGELAHPARIPPKSRMLAAFGIRLILPSFQAGEKASQ